MSSRSLAAARSKRAGEQTHTLSGNKTITSINSQAAFIQQMPPNNVRNSKTTPLKQHNVNISSNGLPFSKLSISDAIGLITLRLGRVEQWMIDTDNLQQEETKKTDIPENHKLIDNSVLASIINRLDSLEKNSQNSQNSQDYTQLSEDIKNLNTQYKCISIELSKYSEQIFKFNRDLIETKDILKTFMLKYDTFVNQTNVTFSDYENALAVLEGKILVNSSENNQSENNETENNETENNQIEYIHN